VIEDFSLDRDVVVRWQVPAETMDAKWTADSDDPSMGTVEVVIRTVNAPLTGMRRRRAVSILLDRSGSMSGWNMDAARRIVEDILGTVSDEDLVHVLAFDNGMEALAPCEHGFVRATARAKSALRRALKKIDARGGTNLTGAITAAGAVLGTVEDMDDSADTERVVVLITDGAYGDEAEAVRQRDLELGGARVIVVGIGQDMNGYLETLSANGLFAFVPSPDRTGDVSRKVCERIAQPAHRNARLAMDGLADQAPHLAPDIYPDATVTLWGRAPRPTADTTVTVVTDSGILAAVPVRVCADSSATSRWAKEHINSIDYDVMSGRVQEAEGRARIIEVSMRRRVLSKYTAWLAIDTSRTTDTIIPKRIVQPTYAMDDLLSSESLGVVYCRTTVRPPMLAADTAWSFAPPMPSMPSIHWRRPSDASAALLEGLIDELNDLVDA
ncbi:MAG: VWA domain-containing protein, partial [Actinobacteria bacterium]|nr:VWA domain-containing protein [Actinomycetota bacterium]